MSSSTYIDRTNLVAICKFFFSVGDKYNLTKNHVIIQKRLRGSHLRCGCSRTTTSHVAKGGNAPTCNCHLPHTNFPTEVAHEKWSSVRRERTQDYPTSHIKWEQAACNNSRMGFKLVVKFRCLINWFPQRRGETKSLGCHTERETQI